MTDPLDPAVQVAVVQVGGGIITGFLAKWANDWRSGRRRASQDQRCARICAQMVTSMEATLAVIEAVGARKPALNPQIDKMREAITEAKRFLDGDMADA